MALRFTEPRKRVFKALKESSSPKKAYDLVGELGDVKSMTVYRALDFLVKNGLAHRIESLNAYVACNEDHCVHKDSQYFICEKCEEVTELHNHAINDMLSERVSGLGLFVQRANIELRGLCNTCQE